MSTSTSSAGESLSKAYRLIEADELPAARAILQPFLASEPDNADAWWLYAHAVSEPDEARKAIDNVLRIDSNYPGAADLKRSLDSVTADDTAAAPVVELDTAPAPAVPPRLPETDELPVVVTGEAPVEAPVLVPADEVVDLPEADLDDERELEEEPEEEPGTSRTLLLVAAAVVILILAAVVVLPMLNNGGDTTGTPTQETAQTSGSGDSTTVAMSAQGDVNALVGAFSAFTLPGESTVTAQSSLGETLFVNVCSEAGQQVRDDVAQILPILVNQVQMAGSVPAIGTRLLNCETQQPLLVLAANRNGVAQYAAGEMSDEDFALLWQPQ